MTLLTAHSGSEGNRANSMEYLESAIKYKADYIEIDVRHTKDKQLVLSHDDEYEGFVLSETTLYQLRETIEILTFEEAADYIIRAGKKVNADIKTIESIPKVADYIYRNHLEKEVQLTGCRDGEVLYLHRHYPELRKLYNVDYLLKDRQLSEEEKRNKILEMINEHKAEGINIPYRELSEERYQWATRFNIDLYVWTIDHKDEMKKNLEREVTSITTNELALFNQLSR